MDRRPFYVGGVIVGGKGASNMATQKELEELRFKNNNLLLELRAKERAYDKLLKERDEKEMVNNSLIRGNNA